MCERGHLDTERLPIKGCRVCEKLRERAKRNGTKLRRVYRYRLNVSALPTKTIHVLCGLAGVPLGTWLNWLYRDHKTSGRTARQVAKNLMIPFEKLWVMQECTETPTRNSDK